jgi:hypothetical protein
VEHAESGEHPPVGLRLNEGHGELLTVEYGPMTEAEWTTCADTWRMLEFVRDKTRARKLRLFAVACCRRHPDQVAEAGAASALEQAEWLADGLLWSGPAADLAVAGGEPVEVDSREMFAWAVSGALDGNAFWGAARAALYAADLSDIFHGDASVRDDLCGYLRCIFGGLFPRPAPRSRPGLTSALVGVVKAFAGSPLRAAQADGTSEVTVTARVNQEWRTSTTVSLAQAIYEDRAFDRLPILADALEEAGCDNTDLLAHCRGDGPHVRGCWVVDLLLEMG